MDKIQKKITVRELVEGFVDNDDEGVRCYGGRLDIRPPYQREFIYKEQQREAVIQTVMKGYPLNTMYWAKLDDGRYEIIDGQQRTMSVCQFVHNVWSVKVDGDMMKFHNIRLSRPTLAEKILDYELTVYACSGTADERLKWFETINIAGEELKPQELRNAVYAGPWVTDAKRYFSKRQCAAYKISTDYVSAPAERQGILELAIKWISETELPNIKKPDERIKTYMMLHQQDADASALWIYFQAVISWVGAKFPVKRKKFMRSVDWGSLYNKYKDAPLDAAQLEAEISRLMMDDDVTAKAGIYPYVLSRDESKLSIRAFTPAQKQAAYERQQGICPICHKHFSIEEMEGDHITPWSKGGHTSPDNCQMLCRECNRRKGGD